MSHALQLYIVFVCIFVIPSSPPYSIFPCTSIAIQRFSRNIQTIFVQQPSPPQLQHLLTPRSLHNVHCSKAHGVLSCDPSAGAWRNPWTYHVFGRLRASGRFFSNDSAFACKDLCAHHTFIDAFESLRSWIIYRNLPFSNFISDGTTRAQSIHKDTLPKSADNRELFWERTFPVPPKKNPHLLKTASSWSWFFFCT